MVSSLIVEDIKPFSAPADAKIYERPRVGFEAEGVLFALIEPQRAEHFPTLTVRTKDKIFEVVPRPHATEFVKFLDDRTNATIYTHMRAEDLVAILERIAESRFQAFEDYDATLHEQLGLLDIESCISSLEGPKKSAAYLAEFADMEYFSNTWIIDHEDSLIDYPQRKVLIPKFTGDIDDRELLDFIERYS